MWLKQCSLLFIMAHPHGLSCVCFTKTTNKTIVSWLSFHWISFLNLFSVMLLFFGVRKVLICLKELCTLSTTVHSRDMFLRQSLVLLCWVYKQLCISRGIFFKELLHLYPSTCKYQNVKQILYFCMFTWTMHRLEFQFNDSMILSLYSLKLENVKLTFFQEPPYKFTVAYKFNLQNCRKLCNL